MVISGKTKGMARSLILPLGSCRPFVCCLVSQQGSVCDMRRSPQCNHCPPSQPMRAAHWQRPALRVITGACFEVRLLQNKALALRGAYGAAATLHLFLLLPSCDCQQTLFSQEFHMQGQTRFAHCVIFQNIPSVFAAGAHMCFFFHNETVIRCT